MMRVTRPTVLLLLLASIVTLSYSQAQQNQPAHILKLTAAGDEAGPKRKSTSGGFRIRAAGYASNGRSRVGYSWVDGRQYSITNPAGAELVHVAQGSVIYVDAKGNEFQIQKGDILLIGPGMNTARDGHDYVHHYITFPASTAGSTLPQQMQRLNPMTLTDADYAQGPMGAEHTYTVGSEGNKVAAWRLAPQGSVNEATESRFIAIVWGSGTFVEGSTQTPIGPGDSILVPKGVAYSWKG